MRAQSLKFSPAATGHCPSEKRGSQGDKVEVVSERPTTLDLQSNLPHPYQSSLCLGGEGKGRLSYRKDGGPGEAGAGLGQQKWGRPPLPAAQLPGRPTSCQGGEASPTPCWGEERDPGGWPPAWSPPLSNPLSSVLQEEKEGKKSRQLGLANI